MREYDDAALELRLRGVLRQQLGALPLDLTVDALDRRRKVRRDDRRRRVLVALGLAAALLVPLGVLGSGGRTLFEAAVVPVPSASALTASPSPSIPFVITGPTSGPGITPVVPGTYRLRGPGYFPAGWPSAVIVTIPDHWWARSALRGAGLVRLEEDGLALAALDVSSVGDLLVRPCGDGDGSPLIEPIGPSVDDLVAGLTSRPGLEFAEPVDIAVDRWPGVRLELTPTSGCGPATLWRTTPQGGESWGVEIGEGWRSRIEIVDIDGLRLVILSSVHLDAPADVQLELEKMVDSIVIEP